VRVHLIGGADKAAELDAKRAIKQGTELALRLSPAPAAAQGTRRKPPMSGLQALGDEMATRLAPYIAMMKGAKA
jgi:2,4-dienoyl-CoA reductase (NADPH2)